MVKVMEEASLPSFGCFVQSLQLVVHDGLLSQRAVKDLLAMCRSKVGHFKHSSVINWHISKRICNCPNTGSSKILSPDGIPPCTH